MIGRPMARGLCNLVEIPVKQSDALRLVWSYIKERNLHRRPGFVVPDETLAPILGKGEIPVHLIARELARFRLSSRAPHESVEAVKADTSFFPHI